MNNQAFNIILWICQSTLAASLFWAAGMKLFRPVSKLRQTWPWAGETPVALVKLTGLADLAGALGLVCPVLLRISPVLTPVAALGVTILMICAGIFHIRRGEASQISINILFALIASFIAWGRF